MRKLILIVQTSLDGFVAGVNGEFDNFIGDDENLGFVCTLIDEADATLMGRVSYQLLNGNWPNATSKPDATRNTKKYSNWYTSVPKYVLSKTLKTGDIENGLVISNNIETEIDAIKNQHGKNILIFGSPTAVDYLLELNLIDSFWVIIHPVIFGEGISLFRDGKNKIKLQLLASKQLSNGTLCNHYSISK